MGSGTPEISIGDALKREVQKSIAAMRKHRERRKPQIVKCHRCRCEIFVEDAVRIEYKRYGLSAGYNVCVMCARRGKRIIGSGVA